MRTLHALCVAATLAGCNAILGIEEAVERPEDGGAAGDSSPNGPLDGSPIDSSQADVLTVRDVGVDAPDASADALADAQVDAPVDAPVDVDAGSPPISCTTTIGTAVEASAANGVGNGPALAFLTPDLWGLAWYNGAIVKYNAITSGGTLQNAADQPLLPDLASGDYATYPRLATLGSSFILAVGVLDNASKPFPAVRLVNPFNGGDAGLIEGAATTPASPPHVGGIAVNTAGSQLVVASRGAAAGQSAGAASLFSSAPGYAATSSPSSKSRATAVGWASGVSRFGVAYIESSPAVGKIATYDSSLAPGPGFDFTKIGDVPVTAGTTAEVAIAGAGGRFAVAWVDERNAPNTEIYVTSVDASTGARVPADEVRASDANGMAKHFARIVYDGQSLGVAWLEFVAGSDFKVMFRRYSVDLTPLPPLTPQCISCPVSSPLTGFGLAVGKRNEYGFAFMSRATTKQYFNRITCGGP